MAEEDIKSDINESKEGSEGSASENEDRGASNGKENGDESKENEKENEKEDLEESKENEKEDEDGDESKENEGGDESKENITDSEKTPKKTVPLYDQPLTQSGKRARAKVEQFKVEPKEEHKYEFNGSGTALGEIPYIEEMINKEIADDLKKLHSLCFGRPGDRLSVKKHLKQFNGYSFDKDDKRYASKKVNMERFKIADLKYICNVLGLERSGVRADLADRVLEFVVKPEDHGKSVPSSKKKRKSKSGRKKKDGGKSKGSRKSKGGDEENDSTANDTADSSDKSGSDDSDSEPEEKPKKTPAKKPGKTPAKKVSSKTPAKKTPAKKTPAKKTPKRSKEAVDSDSDSSDDEPLIKKTKTAPTNDEIKQKVEKILEGADLEEVTMKSVCKQIYDMYPGFDLTDRKSFIKDTVKSELE